jgi:hypothetical protein
MFYCCTVNFEDGLQMPKLRKRMLQMHRVGANKKSQGGAAQRRPLVVLNKTGRTGSRSR